MSLAPERDAHNKNNKLMQRIYKKQKGVSFLEVLIAVVVLSVGFLATSRMQIMGMRYNQSAFFKSQASILAADIADRMRANIGGVDAGAYDSVNTDSLPSDPNCMNTGCNSQELAALDARQWGLSLGNTLPEAKGSVTRNGTMFEVEIEWDEKVSDTVETQSVIIWLNP
ncbi:MAG: type IV pilus modification protein PilV [Gammaproteobacteria bacterium]|nr:type IV pilus modification protein PilV [Gammaproteobacteria bacterium]